MVSNHPGIRVGAEYGVLDPVRRGAYPRKAAAERVAFRVVVVLAAQVRHDPAGRGDELRAGRDQVHELGAVLHAQKLRGSLLLYELGLWRKRSNCASLTACRAVSSAMALEATAGRRRKSVVTTAATASS